MLKIRAPAKINLFLHVTSKREDGYHNIESLFVPLKLSDDIIITESSKIHVTMHGADIKDNTVVKVLSELELYRPKNKGANISVYKNIPIASGMGGSSTDAGTLLIALNKYWDLGLSVDNLYKIAVKIGADVSFFLNPIPSFVSGIGDIIKPVYLNKKFHIVIFCPSIPILSKDVYHNFGGKFTQSIKLENSNLINVIFNGKNGFQQYVEDHEPIVRNLLNDLHHLKGCLAHRMTGSGSACFAIFENKDFALIARDCYSNQYYTYYECINI